MSRVVTPLRPSGRSPRRPMFYGLPAVQEVTVPVWDWTSEDPENLDDPSVDQLSGAVDLTKWTASANVSLTKPATAGGKVLAARLATDFQAGGFFMDTVAGNFVYALRIGVRYPEARVTSLTTREVMAAYFDGANPATAAFACGGWQQSNNALGASYFGAGYKHVNGYNFNSQLAAYISGGGSIFAKFDVWLARVGTDVNVYLAMAGAPPMLFYTYAGMSADAGKVGVRVYNGDAGAAVEAYLFAFARVSAVPGV